MKKLSLFVSLLLTYTVLTVLTSSCSFSFSITSFLASKTLFSKLTKRLLGGGSELTKPCLDEPDIYTLVGAIGVVAGASF